MATNKKREEKRKVHLIGIGGSGMSALAVLLRESGWQVTGTDANPSNLFSAHLEKNKILFYKKYSKKNIPKNVDLVIVGNNAPFSAEINPETRQAVRSGVKIQSMPEALAELSKNKENIVVVGSSGKSTCATLIAWCLTQVKKPARHASQGDAGGGDPSYFIGALPFDLKNSSHLGKDREFVLEGDEYTSSKTDKCSKFLHFDPSSVLLISAQHDHINAFPTEKSYKMPYKKFVAKIPKNGLFVYSLEGKNNKEIATCAECKIVSYALENTSPRLIRLGRKKPDWYAENIKYDIQPSFDLMHKGKKVAKIKTKLLGKHNLENIIGAGALLLEKKKITPEVFAQAIASFHGIKNRLELKTKDSAVPVYEGFGSSYEKAKAFFNTLRLHFPKRRLIAVFEPYAFSWRNRKFLKWYKDIFNNVNEVIMLSATSHGKKAKDQLTSAEIWREVKKYKNIHTVNNEKEGLKILEKIVRKDDVIALVSSGLLFGLTNSAPKLIEKKFPA